MQIQSTDTTIAVILDPLEARTLLAKLSDANGNLSELRDSLDDFVGEDDEELEEA